MKVALLQGTPSVYQAIEETLLGAGHEVSKQISPDIQAVICNSYLFSSAVEETRVPICVTLMGMSSPYSGAEITLVETYHDDMLTWLKSVESRG